VAAGAISLSEALGRAVSRAEVEQALLAEAEGVWGRLVAEAPTAEEWQDAERLVLERYGNENWTMRR
jgi:lipoate-protein ligase A